MTVDNAVSLAVRRVVVATDRSKTADRAVGWASRLAEAYGAELLLLQVLPATAGASDGVAAAAADLTRYAESLAGVRGRAKVVVDADPAQAILDAVEEERADNVVVGNVGMSGRKQFLLGNIPNRISHSARCSIVIVNTMGPDGQPKPNGAARRAGTNGTPGLEEGQLLRRAWRIGWILASAGAGAMRSGSKNGDRGVVKVQRPTAEQDIQQDLALLEMFGQRCVRQCRRNGEHSARRSRFSSPMPP
jgi:nucleotide-binding universal stress UspA family protein